MLACVGCSAPAAPVSCDPQAFRAVQLARANRTEVTVCGPVVRVGPIRRSRSGTHRDFIIEAGANNPVLIDANLDIIGDLPVRLRETAMVRGEYYNDGPNRDGVHWTHRTLRGTHPAGFIVLDGITYR